MALARSASGPGGLSINTSSANLFCVMDKQAAKDAAAADLRRMLAEAKAELMANRAKRDTLVQQKANAVQQTVNKFLSSGSASSAAPSAGGLFGTASQPQTTQPSTGSGLFGAASSAAPSTGGLFGNAAATPQPAAETTQQSTGSGLFGSLNPNANTQNAQPAQAGGQLFGNAPSNAAQPQQQTGLFGSSTANNTQPQQQQQQQQTTGLFGASTQTAQPAQNTSAFGSSILGGGNQQNSNAFSTLGAQSTNQQTVPGVRIDLSNVRGTTRFNDLQEDLQKKIVWLDDQIQSYMNQKHELDAFMPGHGDMLSNIPNDVKFVQMKYDGVESALRSDAEAIESVQLLHQKDAENGRLCFRALDNLKLPQQYHTSGLWSSRAQAGASTNTESDGQDIVNFFSKTASEMDEQLQRYESNLTEIELHMHGIQGSLIEQLQRMMATKNGGPSPSDEKLAELGAVLRDFEQSILEVAQQVGGAREGMTRLQLGDFLPSRHHPRSGVY
ncbi:hypothetical protein G7054_g13026 [Neopestalotiopsis clavispora]|nr:hypothetical protein G7054_g13026 [Neopestalotiopsis clavispora]